MLLSVHTTVFDTSTSSKPKRVASHMVACRCLLRHFNYNISIATRPSSVDDNNEPPPPSPPHRASRAPLAPQEEEEPAHSQRGDSSNRATDHRPGDDRRCCDSLIPRLLHDWRSYCGCIPRLRHLRPGREAAPPAITADRPKLCAREALTERATGGRPARRRAETLELLLDLRGDSRGQLLLERQWRRRRQVLERKLPISTSRFWRRRLRKLRWRPTAIKLTRAEISMRLGHATPAILLIAE